MMRFSHQKVEAFKRYLIVFIGVNMLVLGVPNIINYYAQLFSPVPDIDRILSLIWIIPAVSLAAAFAAALFIKNRTEN